MEELKIIARMHSDFPDKFGIPRQSGLVGELRATIVFEPEFRNAEALRGLEDFSYIWLIWGFSAAKRDSWSPTVRPPRLGGNKRMGVFATRSPFRPNSLGLSAVQLDGIEIREGFGTVIHVRGADLMDGTPIYDIKPYLPYADCHPEATGGFAAKAPHMLEVNADEAIWINVPEDKIGALRAVLANDPRPSYQDDPKRVYGMAFGGLEVKFRVEKNILTIVNIENENQMNKINETGNNDGVEY